MSLTIDFTFFIIMGMIIGFIIVGAFYYVRYRWKLYQQWVEMQRFRKSWKQ